MRLYWQDPYMREFDSTILDIVDGEKIVLAETAFYAESGGQLGDIGTINGLAVGDTTYSKSGKTIYHVMNRQAASSLKKNSIIHGVIDWDRRYKLMRLHSALHIAYLLFQKHYGTHKVVGSQVRDDKSRVDFEYFEEVDEQLLQQEMESILSMDLPIKLYPSETDPNYRYWEISGFPPIPCGGTHPRNVNEIGYIKLSKQSKGAQGIRLYCEFIPTG